MVLNIAKLVAEARAADPSFTPKESENIFCFHQNMLYEAKVRGDVARAGAVAQASTDSRLPAPACVDSCRHAGDVGIREARRGRNAAEAVPGALRRLEQEVRAERLRPRRSCHVGRWDEWVPVDRTLERNERNMRMYEDVAKEKCVRACAALGVTRCRERLAEEEKKVQAAARAQLLARAAVQKHRELSSDGMVQLRKSHALTHAEDEAPAKRIKITPEVSKTMCTHALLGAPLNYCSAQKLAIPPSLTRQLSEDYAFVNTERKVRRRGDAASITRTAGPSAAHAQRHDRAEPLPPLTGAQRRQQVRCRGSRAAPITLQSPHRRADCRADAALQRVAQQAPALHVRAGAGVHRCGTAAVPPRQLLDLLEADAGAVFASVYGAEHLLRMLGLLWRLRPAAHCCRSADPVVVRAVGRGGESHGARGPAGRADCVPQRAHCRVFRRGVRQLGAALPPPDSVPVCVMCDVVYNAADKPGTAQA